MPEEPKPLPAMIECGEDLDGNVRWCVEADKVLTGWRTLTARAKACELDRQRAIDWIYDDE